MENQNRFMELFLKKKDSFRDILGQDEAKAQLKSALISNRHILIIGPPGIGKTTLAKNVAGMLPGPLLGLNDQVLLIPEGGQINLVHRPMMVCIFFKGRIQRSRGRNHLLEKHL